MLRLFAFLLFAALPALASPLPLPVEIPSAVTADYTGSGYACRFVGNQYFGGTHYGLEVRCTRPNNEQTIGLAVGPACPSDEWLIPLAQWGGGDQEGAFKLDRIDYMTSTGPVSVAGPGLARKVPATWLKVVGYDLGRSVTVRIGRFDEIAAPANGGTLVTLTHREWIVPALPYAGCGAPAEVVRPPVAPPAPRAWLCAITRNCGR